MNYTKEDMKMKRIIAVIFITFLLSLTVYGEMKANEGDSVAEFPVIVIVGQIVEITPFSVVFENTYEGTNVTDDQIKNIIEYYSSSVDHRAHGFANALKVVSVKNGKMRVSLYLDNILLLFDDDIRTYMKYIPVYYMFRNNIQDMRIPKHIVEELKKHPYDHYLNLPMAKELMKNSWMAGVFRIDPDSKKLVYHGARFFNNFDEMDTDEWAREYRIPDIVKKGMVVTMSKSIVIGNESKDPKPEDKKDEKDGTKPAGKKFLNKNNDLSGEEKK
jgi:hypothetical protein